MTDFKKSILKIVSKIPKGKVVSYGDIAKAIGTSNNARVVGFILTGLTSEESKIYPWHRVVDRNGFISSSKLGQRGLEQQALLKVEGIEIKDFKIINIQKYWYN